MTRDWIDAAEGVACICFGFAIGVLFTAFIVGTQIGLIRW